MLQTIIFDEQNKKDLLKLIDDEVWSLATSEGVEMAGSKLNERVEPDVDHFTGRLYWEYFKREFFELMCESTEKYARERKMMQSARPHLETIVLAISSGIAGYMMKGTGLAATLVPFVSMGLLGSTKLGLEAWCSCQRDQIRFEKNGAPILLDDKSEIEGNTKKDT